MNTYKTTIKTVTAVIATAIALTFTAFGSAASAAPIDDLEIESSQPNDDILLPTGVPVSVDLDCSRQSPVEIHATNHTLADAFVSWSVDGVPFPSAVLLGSGDSTDIPIDTVEDTTVTVKVSSSTKTVEETFDIDCEVSNPGFTIATVCSPESVEVTLTNTGGTAIAYFDVIDATASISKSPELGPDETETVAFAVPSGETHDFEIWHNGLLFHNELVTVDCEEPPAPTTPAPTEPTDAEPTATPEPVEANGGDEDEVEPTDAGTESEEAKESDAADADESEDAADDAETEEVAAPAEIGTRGSDNTASKVIWGGLALVLILAAGASGGVAIAKRNER